MEKKKPACRKSSRYFTFFLSVFLIHILCLLYLFVSVKVKREKIYIFYTHSLFSIYFYLFYRSLSLFGTWKGFMAWQGLPDLVSQNFKIYISLLLFLSLSIYVLNGQFLLTGQMFFSFILLNSFAVLQNYIRNILIH